MSVRSITSILLGNIVFGLWLSLASNISNPLGVWDGLRRFLCTSWSFEPPLCSRRSTTSASSIFLFVSFLDTGLLTASVRVPRDSIFVDVAPSGVPLERLCDHNGCERVETAAALPGKYDLGSFPRYLGFPGNSVLLLGSSPVHNHSKSITCVGYNFMCTVGTKRIFMITYESYVMGALWTIDHGLILMLPVAWVLLSEWASFIAGEYSVISFWPLSACFGCFLLLGSGSFICWSTYPFLSNHIQPDNFVNWSPSVFREIRLPI